MSFAQMADDMPCLMRMHMYLVISMSVMGLWRSLLRKYSSAWMEVRMKLA